MTTPLQVLIVDDSPIVRERLARLLDDVPHSQVIGHAVRALDAIEQIRHLRPDALILDISMPEGSGMYVLEAVKQESPKTRVLMLTNFASDQYREKCRQLGADAFLDKSTEFENIPRVLEAWNEARNAEAA